MSLSAMVLYSVCLGNDPGAKPVPKMLKPGIHKGSQPSQDQVIIVRSCKVSVVI